MKRLGILMIFLLIFTMVSFPVSAEIADKNIPLAQSAPTIDGIFNADEWQGAWQFVLDANNPPRIVVENAISEEYYPTYTFYAMWDPDNFYFACVTKGDKTVAPRMGSYMDTRDNSIRGDGFQLFMNPTGDYSKTTPKDDSLATYGGSYIWTDFYCDYKDDAVPFTWPYCPFDGDLYDDTQMPMDVLKQYIIEGTRDGENWAIEVMVPWKVLNSTTSGTPDMWDMTIPRKSGDKLIMDFNTLDYDGTGNGCRYGITENGVRVDGSLDNWEQFTLTDTPAGKAPVAETEAPVVAQLPADAAAPASASAQTSDILVLAVVAAAISAVGIRVKSKKR